MRQKMDCFISNNFGTEPVIIRQLPLPIPDSREERDKMDLQDTRRDAISVQCAWKRYGKPEKGVQVLTDLTLTVKEGTIYTLLGSSGCGKTTLLSCIVGMNELDQGECKIFGLKPGTKGSGIPGNKVGYMPQEIALYGEFTIREAMLYFGKINGMTSIQIVDRMTFLIKFLHLPPSHRPIRSLSGGQQRRVSFAVALLHEPPILILDEPTVGVDPLLRKSIWKHLKELVDARKTTVVITTHYIEEATEAHRIGLMRNGHLLAEDSPQNLLEEFECAKLEDVFFKLCQLDSHDENGSVLTTSSSMRSSNATTQDTENNSASETASTVETVACVESNTVALENEKNANQNKSVASSPITPVFNTSVENLIDTPVAKDSKDKVTKGKESKVAKKWGKKEDGFGVENLGSNCCSDMARVFDRMNALLLKNFICMWRNIGFILFIFLLPALQAVLFCVAIGGDPSNLPLGVVNHEVYNITECRITPGCSVSNMSCNFLKLIPNRTLDMISFETEADALREAKNGNIWGFMVIPKNFSDAMIQKGVSGKTSNSLYEDGFQGTHIKLNLDMTSQQIAFSVQNALAKTFQMFTTNMLFDCGMNETLDLPPSSFAVPIYGGSDSSFREFMAPGIILSIIFFMSVALTGSAFITERKEGMMQRTQVAGVTTGEIITAHLMTQYVIMAGQTMLVLAVMIWVFHVEIAGSIGAAVVLTLVQGTCGMAYGFLISCICTEERNAIQMALGSFYPNLLLSGVVWPLESIPVLIRKVAVFLPQTMACEAMRSIFSRAWPITHPKVWPGFASSAVWSIIFWTCALFLARMQRK